MRGAVIVSSFLLAAAPALRAQQLQTIVLRGEELAKSKALVMRNDASIRPAMAKLKRDADKEMSAPIVAVTDKSSLMPPSGDKHDYFSLSPYWWPDPAKADGLPYIRRDGVTNPASKRDLDRPRLGQMVDNVTALSLAYYFTGDQKYAMRSARQLRAWFLNADTRMNPNLHFSQLVRGNPEERGSGIIDTHNFIDVVDASLLLVGSAAWTPKDEDALRAWMHDYLRWLLDSPNGKHEHDAPNNHGSWYAAQTATLALFTGDSALARSIASDARARIDAQIKPDGSQPRELERTKSMHYSGFNAEALARLADVGRRVGVDLWTYQGPNGGSIRRSLDHLAEFLPRPKSWPGDEISDVEEGFMLETLRDAQVALGAPVYAATFAQLPQATVRASRSMLLYPSDR